MNSVAVAVTIVVLSVSAYDNSSGQFPLGITSSGVPTRHGICACGTQFDFGTLFVIPKMGIFRCEDRGGLISNRHLDLWMFAEEDALEWGRQELVVIIINPDKVRGLRSIFRRYSPRRENTLQ